MNGNKKANTRRNRGRAAWLWLSIVLCLALLMGTAALAEGLVDENTGEPVGEENNTPAEPENTDPAEPENNDPVEPENNDPANEDTTTVDPQNDDGGNGSDPVQTPVQYTIRFFYEDGTQYGDSQVLNADDDIVYPSVPGKSSDPEKYNAAWDYNEPKAIENKDIYPVYTIKTFTITWVNGDNATIKTDTVEYGITPDYSGDTPTKTETEHTRYEFNNSWTPEIVPATDDAKYTAQFTETTFYNITWKWKNANGDQTETAKVDAGVTPAHDDPPEWQDAQNTYTFARWDPVPSAASADADYTAQYNTTPKAYTITWNNDDGTLIEKTTVNAGVTPEHAGPTKAPTAQYTYTFSNWNPAPAAATGDATYTAVFTASTNKYNVTFVNEDGTSVLKEATAYDYGTVGTAIAQPDPLPTKAPDADNMYTFTGWTPALDGSFTLTAETTFKAVYTAESLTKTSGDYTYKLDPVNNTATIIGWSGKDDGTGVTVPAQLDNLPVVGIGDNAFKDKTDLTKLTVPAGVKTIGENAIAGCTALTSLTLPDTLESMASTALTGDDALTSIVLSCTGNTTLNPANTINHDDAVDGKPAPVALPSPYNFTDLTVTTNTLANPVTNGKLTVACDFTVAKDHAVNVEAGSLTNNAKMTNLGAINVTGGTFTNSGTVLSCAGTVSGTIGGTPQVTKHDFKDGKCTVCGAEQPKLSVKYKGKAVSKVYDKTRNVKLSKNDFEIEDTFGLDISISGISASYDKPDAGKRTVNVTLTLSGADAALFGGKITTKVSATIEPKPLIITPTAGQKKTYGASNPTNYTGKVKGLLSGDKISGKLSRKAGEDVGKYLIEQGTIDAGGNYDVQVVEEYFTIEAKSINASDVGLVTIGNQRYTGQEVKPAITLRYGTRTLKEGTDFKATFTDNVQPGMATVKLTGIGNYTGTRETTFRILNIASGVDTSTTGSGSSYGYGGFDDGEEESDEDYEEEEDAQLGKLVIDEKDYGTILFNGEGKPAPFVQFIEEVEPEIDLEGESLEADENAPKEWVLTIVADPMIDEETGETLLLDDGEREQYDELHLRLTTTLIDTLKGLGYTEIVYQVEDAELHIPLESLVSEIELEQQPEAEVISIIEGEENEDGEVEEDIEELEMDLAPTSITIEAYDIMIEQSEVAVLTEREITTLAGYAPLMPTYRVHVRGVVASEDGQNLPAATVTDENGETLVELPPAERLPENGYPVGLVLHVTPTEDLAGETDEETDEETSEETTEAVALFISTVETSEDVDVIQETPAAFVDVDGQTFAEFIPTADGLYGVGTPLPEDGELEDIG